MNLYDGNGTMIVIDGGITGTVTPVDTTFFNVTIPNYTNLFNGERETGWYSSGSTFNSAVGAATTSDYIELPNTSKYVYSQIAQSVICNPDKVVTSTMAYLAMTFFNSEKTFISTFKPTGGAVGTSGNYPPVEIPSGAKYVRVSFGGAYMDKNANFFVGVAEDNSASVLPWEDYYEAGAYKTAFMKHDNLSYTDEPPHKGKKWVLFGDSLTDSYGGHDWQESTSPVGGTGWKNTEERVPWTGQFWATRIAREMGLTIDNRAASGSNINESRVYSDVTGIKRLDAFLAEIEAGTIEQPEYITIGFGTNTVGDEIGINTDTSENTASVYGAVKYFIEKLREKCPYSVIGFVLSPKGDWSQSGISRDIEGGRTAIKAVLDTEEYSVPYVDMWTESGITVDMLPDGIHVSSIEANNLYYHAMRRFMMGL